MRISQVFKYYTGDDFDEFDRDLPHEDLARISDSEIITKEDGEGSSFSKKKKKTKFELTKMQENMAGLTSQLS